MRSLGSSVTALLASGQVVLVQLVLFEFPSGDVALNASNWDLTWSGITYRGADGLGAVSPVNDRPGEVQGITLELIGADSASIALALDDADEVQGTPVTIRTALLDSSTYQILDAPIDWVGTCDRMSIAEDGETCNISVSAESSAVQLLRGNFLDVQLALQQSASLPLQLQVFGADGGIAKLRFQLRNAPALRQ